MKKCPGYFVPLKKNKMKNRAGPVGHMKYMSKKICVHRKLQNDVNI